MTDELKDLEDTLKRVEPACLSPELLDRLDSAMSRWKELDFDGGAESKVVPFPQAEDQKGGNRDSIFSLPWLSAAAAVAILGASAAIFMSPDESMPQPQIVEKVEAKPSLPQLQRNFTNVSGDRLYWKDEHQPMRQMSLEYVDRVRVQDENGRVFLLEQPKRQTFLVPMRTD